MTEKLEDGELYRGPCGVLKDSNWLSAETIPQDRDTVVEIEAVVRRKVVKFKNETKQGYGSLRFRGKDKELGLNATHIAVLSKLFGPNTGDWFGKRVALYVDPNVSAFGKVVSAVRIRAKRIEAATGKPTTTARPDPEREALISELSEESIQGDVRRHAAATGLPEDASVWTTEQMRAIRDLVFSKTT